MSNWQEREYAEQWGPLVNLPELLAALTQEIRYLRQQLAQQSGIGPDNWPSHWPPSPFEDET